LTHREIGDEVDLSERQVARILRERGRAHRSSVSEPSDAEWASDASVTELLDQVQTAVGQLAAVAHGRWEPDPTLAVRIALAQSEAERAIEVLRRRSVELLPETS
jgi:hypothetical protein